MTDGITRTSDCHVYIVVLNWHGWGDTLECLESVFRLNYNYYTVILCDNGSTDGSYQNIKAWAAGDLVAWHPRGPLDESGTAPFPKPIPYAEYDRGAAESGGAPNDGDKSLILIQTGENLGYGGGNNVGIRYAMARGDFAYLWLLNNDTVVEPGTLTKMVDAVKAKPNVGVCGGTSLYYHAPSIVDSLGGGSFNPWLGLPKRIANDTIYEPDRIDAAEITKKLDYISGASLLVTNQFLTETGVISEEYFLYYEELDWVKRASATFSLCYAPDSIVYHKSGSTIGSSGVATSRSQLSEYYSKRSRIKFIRKYYPLAIVPVYLVLVFTLVYRLIFGPRELAFVIKDVLLNRDFAGND